MEHNFFLSFQRTISRSNRTSVKEGRFPFRQTFWKFWLGAKWKMILWFAPLENSRKKSGTSKKVFPFSRLECSEWIFVFHYHDSCISYQFQVHRKKFVMVINFGEKMAFSGSVYNLLFQYWLNGIAFKSWMPSSWNQWVCGVWNDIFKYSSSLRLPPIIGKFCWHPFRTFPFFRHWLYRF